MEKEKGGIISEYAVFIFAESGDGCGVYDDVVSYFFSSFGRNDSYLR